MKRIQGSASTKTFEQIKTINRAGEYTIGTPEPDYMQFLQREMDVNDVIELRFNKRAGGTRRMTLKEIEDLQSSLMLLGREARGGAENHDEAETEKNLFVEVNILSYTHFLSQNYTDDINSVPSFSYIDDKHPNFLC